VPVISHLRYIPIPKSLINEYNNPNPLISPKLHYLLKKGISKAEQISRNSIGQICMAAKCSAFSQKRLHALFTCYLYYIIRWRLDSLVVIFVLFRIIYVLFVWHLHRMLWINASQWLFSYEIWFFDIVIFH